MDITKCHVFGLLLLTIAGYVSCHQLGMPFVVWKIIELEKKQHFNRFYRDYVLFLFS